MNASAKFSVRKAGRVGEKCTLLLQTQILESVSVGKRPDFDTRQASKPQQNIPLGPLLVTQHTSCHSNQMGRHRREMELRQREEPR